LGTGGLAHFPLLRRASKTSEEESCTKAGSIELDDVRSDRRSLKDGEAEMSRGWFD
jgi:hypothetical protein